MSCGWPAFRGLDRPGPLVQVSVKVTVDTELADHTISFLNAVLSSLEAQHALPLRLAFVHALLDLGGSLPLTQLRATAYGVLGCSDTLSLSSHPSCVPADFLYGC